MNRIQTIKEALGVKETQALITAELLKPLKDEDIIPFFAYRTSFIQPKQSSELITKNAVAAFRKQKALEAIKDFVIIGVDEYGNLINHYQINQAGKPVQLSSDSEAEVYAWLFENQKRIGVIKYVSEREVKEKEKEQAKIEVANNVNLLPTDPDAPIEMSDEARARLRLGLSAIAANIAKRA